jgi:hypothetical protein
VLRAARDVASTATRLPVVRRRTNESISGIGIRYRRPPGAHRLVGARAPDVALLGRSPRLYEALRSGRFVLVTAGFAPPGWATLSTLSLRPIPPGRRCSSARTATSLGQAHRPVAHLLLDRRQPAHSRSCDATVAVVDRAGPGHAGDGRWRLGRGDRIPSGSARRLRPSSSSSTADCSGSRFRRSCHSNGWQTSIAPSKSAQFRPSRCSPSTNRSRTRVQSTIRGVGGRSVRSSPPRTRGPRGVDLGWRAASSPATRRRRTGRGPSRGEPARRPIGAGTRPGR